MLACWLLSAIILGMTPWGDSYYNVCLDKTVTVMRNTKIRAPPPTQWPLSLVCQTLKQSIKASLECAGFMEVLFQETHLVGLATLSKKLRAAHSNYTAV